MSLYAVARPAALEPGPLVTLVRCRALARVDSIVILIYSSDHGPDLDGRVVDNVGDAAWRGFSGGYEQGPSLSK